MFIQPFFVKGLAHSSYLLGARNTCAIVDPRRDVEVYLDAAKEMGMQITHVLETHLHADFVSGHMELADRTGAKICAPKAGQCKFKHVALAGGDTVEIEDLEISGLETPGHTPEHVSYVVVDRARGKEPVCVFCGDTLFVGDVGRPDLFPGIAKELASKLFDSLHEKLMKLPDFCEVLPAHGAGSLCGRSLGANRTSTIGYERLHNRALQIGGRDEFIRSLTTDMPAAPDHFSRLSAVNRAGPTLVRELGALAYLSPAEFVARKKKKNTIVLDVRSYEAFGGQHVPGAWHIDAAGNFSTFAGWVLPPDADILLVAATPPQASEAVAGLRRVGLDRAAASLDGAMFEWSKAGLPTGHVPQLSAAELHRMGAGKEKITVVDVRMPREFEKSHIQGAVNIPAPDLRTRYKELGSDLPVVTVCSTGHRSSLAASILKQKGFEDVRNLAGGMTGYAASGLAPECATCLNVHGPTFLGK
jgi:glyoxylase-like metal-dependent hydrolase (beta-lactamase superfamily II)